MRVGDAQATLISDDPHPFKIGNRPDLTYSQAIMRDSGKSLLHPTAEFNVSRPVILLSPL
jgi:hypothetical protein